MKKNMIMRFASLLLVVTLLSTCAISGTFAKYTSGKSAFDTATVAKWSFKVGGADIASNSFSFNLFDTINDTGNSVAETDVALGMIAPGTAGSFALELKNESEVTAQYAIDYTVTNTSNIPIKFSVDGKTWTDDLADVTASDATKLAVGAEAQTITVQWMWAFEGSDNTDTNLGTAGTAEVTVSASVTATQVD